MGEKIYIYICFCLLLTEKTDIISQTKHLKLVKKLKA